MRDERKTRFSLWARRTWTGLCNLMFPPRCVGCRKYFYTGFPEYTTDAFCEACARRFRMKEQAGCPKCGLTVSMCRCRRLPLMKADAIVSVIPYDPEGKSIAERVILFMKDRKNRRLSDFLAEEMRVALYKRLEYDDIDPSGITLTYIPRDRLRFAVSGTDQAHELARALARRTGAPLVSLFDRKPGRGEQKTKTVRERMENVKGMFSLSQKAREAARSVSDLVIIDDVLTTGSTLGAAVDACKPFVSGKIVVLTLGQTPSAR